MPRTYKPASGTRQYKKYTDVEINAALKEYETKNSSLSAISRKFSIPKSVLHRHHTRHMKKHGGQTVLTTAEEDYVVENINHCAEWGYPLDTYDLRLLVKGYLDKKGIIAKRFKDNLPGPDFVKSFLYRNKEKISLRISQNIKRSRASISQEVIEEYFTELETSLAGVPLGNIVNYDETNLADDPGRRKVITKRGAKYPERIMNHSKASTSLMMAASADGVLLPCYVVYKSKNLYESWCENGPKDCRYNCTGSGWFDSVTFEDWVRTIALPYFKGKEGKKILIGDNLSSHLSLDLIRECSLQNVHFIFLPPNSTHLTQPLDVAFFRPTKGAWRDILFFWKKTDGRTLPTIPKSVFPTLLRKLITRIENQVKPNILAGFMKTGISPLNKNKVLERLPGNITQNDQNLDKNAVDQTVISMLQEMRYGSSNNKPYSKRKKIEIRPGQSVCVEPETEESDMSERENDQEENSVYKCNNETDLEESQELLEMLIPASSNTENCKIKPKLTKNIIQPVAKLIVQDINKNTKPAVAKNMKPTLCTVISTVSNRKDSLTTERNTTDSNEAQSNSTLTENIKARYTIAKLIPEERKRKFEAKSIMEKLTNPLLGSVPSKDNDQKIIKTVSIKKKYGPKSGSTIPRQPNTGKATKSESNKSEIIQKYDAEPKSKIIKYENKNEDVFKKPYPYHKFKRNDEIKQKQENQSRITIDDSEKKQILNFDDHMFSNIGELEIEKMPLFFDDNFCFQEEIVIFPNEELMTEQPTERENNKENIAKEEQTNEEIQISNEKTTDKIKLISVENFKTKENIKIDFKQLKKIALNDKVTKLGTVKNKHYSIKDKDILKDEDILRVLMDDDI